MHQDFCRELATALLENENREASASDRIHRTYRSLCFDEPQLPDDAATVLLARALRDRASHYRLSAPLVRGVGRLEGEAYLSATIHLVVSLEILLSESLVDAQLYLGSFPDTPHLPPESAVAPVVQPAEAHHPNGTDHDSLQEIFAEESDDSDFGFESDWDPQQQVAALNAWAEHVEDAFDPLRLSQSETIASWHEVSVVLSQLLQDYSYSSLSSLSATQWNELELSDKLLQMSLALLGPSETQRTSMVLRESRYDPGHWQTLGLRVVHIVRDAYAAQEARSAVRRGRLESYLQLLQIFIQFDQSTTANKSVEPATWVGVSCLSGLCIDCDDDSQEEVSTITTSISKVVDELSLLLEKSTSPDKAAEDLQAILLTFVPILRLVSTQNDRVQSLLSSGLYRQWLLTWSNLPETLQPLVQESVFDLAVASPTVLGKYAWRFKGFAAVVVATPRLDTVKAYDSHLWRFLWNLLGVRLTTESGPSAVQWKGSASTTAITLAGCQANVTGLFPCICQNVLRVLTDWQLRLSNELGFQSTTEQVKILNDLIGLSERLENKLLRSLFVQNIDGSTAREQLKPIQAVLSKWPQTKDTKADEKTQDTSDPKKTTADSMVPAVRKAIKTMLTIIESGEGPKYAAFSSKAD